jgi:hypothetical protein
MLDAHTRLEPLAVGVGQRHGGDRQVEQPGRHARDAVEGFAGRRVQQVQFIERVHAACFGECARNSHDLVFA